MARILVTGGAGFIGSHLCDALISAGHVVICLDNLLSGTSDNIKHLEANPAFRFIHGDVTTVIEQDLGQLDAILHFASLASPNPKSPISYMKYPVETLLTNTVGTKNMLDLATKHDCQIILASTAEVYGDPEVHPQPETYVGHVSPIGIRSSYDEGKRAAEAFAMAYHRTRGTRIKIVRIFNTYGPRMRLDDGRVIPGLMRSYLKHEPFAIFGNNSTTRSLAYVDDIVRGILSVYREDAMIGEVVNLGNPKEYTLGEIVKIFEQVAGSVLEKKIEPAPPEDPVRRQPDITKAKKLLHWSPETSFETGLRYTIDSYKTPQSV